MNRSPWVFAVLALATVGALFAARGRQEAHAYAQCLTTAECQKHERCAVDPKGDGFATLGQCTTECSSDAQCLNGWKCLPFADVGAFLVTPGTKEAQAAKRAARNVCSPPRS